LRHNLILSHVGQVHRGGRSHFEATFIEIEIGGATALANHVDHRGPLRAQTRCQMNTITAANAGPDGRALRNDSPLWNGRAIELAVDNGEQPVIQTDALRLDGRQLGQIGHIDFAAMNGDPHGRKRRDERHSNQNKPEHNNAEEGLHATGVIVSRQNVDNRLAALDTGDNVGTTTDKAELLRKLPSVDAILRSPALETVVAREGQTAVADAARTVLARIREEVLAARLDDNGVRLALSGLAEAVEKQMRANLAYSLRPVVNATGVILHTNLGRAPLCADALEHICEVAGTYSNLEFDIEAGGRGKRDVHVNRLFAQLLGDTERDVWTVVVNNNAAAVLIALNTLAEGGEVIVSRGELVEIGGSFRVPDVMAKSGATLREVGTTNRTRAADYENAITDKTRLLMRVHRSNFEMVGFTEQPSLQELVEVGRKHAIPVLEDVGSGAFFDLRNVNLHGEPTILESIRAGVDVVTYSGDKLLGGPQAGMISGTRELVAKIRKNPLFRALRVDKLTYAGLEATILAYVKQNHDAIPAIRMMRISEEELERRAEAIRERVAGAPITIEIVESESVIGGGAAPTATLKTRALAITAPEADDIAEQLRLNDPPVITRVEDNRVLLDLRTVFPEQDEQIVRALLVLKS